MTTEHINQLEPTLEQHADERRPSCVVGIGASAGGLEALECLFQHMPRHTGMAFVVVQHLSPDFKSLMDELLARKTEISIYRASEGMLVEADAIYLIPPRKDMVIVNGRLLLTDKDPKQLVTLPIDHFFRSLAHDLGDRAIGIVLSGTGSDGSRGIRDIHEAGGLVVVQTPESAKFDGMPNSACQTGAVDLVLPPEEIPAALARYVQHPFGQDRKPEPSLPEDAPSGVDAIFRSLRDEYGIDFSHYKSSTVTRRIERRLLLNRNLNLDDYVSRLQHDTAELNALYKDLLIGVTRFFRDTNAFERLAQEVSALLRSLDREEDFRVWVAGCATGEEAYSLAILIQEQIEQLGRPIKVKVFATDVHRASIDIAGAGLYTEAQLADVNPQRLARFFVRKRDGYQVAHELRQMVVFAPHNVIKDAPFTKLDLVTCRNMLIYLQPLVQKKVISYFHFALKTGGVLFLGPSESPGELSDEFEVLDHHWKIYRKRRDIRLPTDLRLPLSSGTPVRMPGNGGARGLLGGGPDNSLMGVYDALLEQCLPTSLLVNERREVVQTFGGANCYLSLKDGRLSTNVLDMVDPDLRVVLGGALPRVIAEKTPVSYKGLRVRIGTEECRISLTIKPVEIRRPGGTHALIVIEDQGSAPPLPSPEATELDVDQASREQVQALESELRFTKENLQATIEELETSNEELQATNEEMVASNEELQSTNEELHSVNEELYTVNAEYQKKIAELTALTTDMDNLLESTQVHTLFLDRALAIRKFTPRIADTFHLLPQDIGRPIDGFSHSIDHPTLGEDLRRVMETGEPFEQPVRDRRGHYYLLRILPYQARQSIDGIVLTLIDIDKLKRAEEAVRTQQQQLSGILNHSPHLVSIKDLHGRYLVADHAFREIVGCDPTGKTAHEIYPAATADVLVRDDQRVAAENATLESEVVIPHGDEPHTYLAVKFPVRDEAGQIIGVGSIKTDVTRLKTAEKQAREAVEQRDRFLAMLSHELRNPLGAMVNAAFVLEHNPPGNEQYRIATNVIQRQATQMTRLLDDLLDISRITQNKIQLRRVPTELMPLIAEAQSVVRAAFQAAQLVLEVQPSSEPLVVNGDPARLQQMLVNLLTNSAKYTPAGGRVHLDLARSGREGVIRVRDTGAGIREDMLEKVFDLFVQADETLDRSKSGLGVGLTMVRSIAELHGGRVRAFSRGQGLGSEFVVWLPLAETPARPEPVAPAAPIPPVKVLIIEDNEDSRKMLESILRLDGHQVLTASDGQQGVELILRERPELAIVDIGLPRLNGYDVAKQVRSQLGPNVRLVALTGYGRPEDRRAVLEAGYDEHLVKPLKRGDLETVLRHAAGGKAQRS
ncbi:MAG: PAS domain-containing protein [Gemmataceae bacterium]|nr:PAS domain-containing protein [Gemmataceae bacterium]